MPSLILRTFLLYLLVVASLRLMGKKQIGQLEPSELAVAIMIAELACIPLSGKNIPLSDGVIPVLTLACSEVLISWLILKNVRLRKYISGRPSVLVENGVLNQKNMRILRFTADDLLEEMRQKGVTNISDIQYAIMETNGRVSFILKKSSSGPTVEDLSLSIPEEQMPFPIIIKGVIYRDNLHRIHRNEEWLAKELKRLQIENQKQVLLMCANDKKVTFVQLFS